MTQSNFLSLLAAVSITATGLLAIAAPASAKDRPVVVTARITENLPTRRVSYADLNLASLDGEKTLIRRVGGAVRSVCDESVGINASISADSECRSFAWGGARPQIARAVRRARDIARTGSSSISAVAIRIAATE